MRYFILIPCLIFCLSLISPAVADEVSVGGITIVSPQDKAVVRANFELRWALSKDSGAAHVHLYIDDRSYGPKTRNSFVIKGLERGEHTIELRPATADHKETGEKGSVTVIVR